MMILVFQKEKLLRGSLRILPKSLFFSSANGGLIYLFAAGLAVVTFVVSRFVVSVFLSVASAVEAFLRCLGIRMS